MESNTNSNMITIMTTKLIVSNLTFVTQHHSQVKRCIS